MIGSGMRRKCVQGKWVTDNLLAAICGASARKRAVARVRLQPVQLPFADHKG